MIRVTLELLPRGDESRKRILGVGYITNTGTSDNPGLGNYDVKLMKSLEYAKRSGVWKRGSVLNFPRVKLGPWELLICALGATVGSRVKNLPILVKEIEEEKIGLDIFGDLC